MLHSPMLMQQTLRVLTRVENVLGSEQTDEPAAPIMSSEVASLLTTLTKFKFTLGPYHCALKNKEEAFAALDLCAAYQELPDHMTQEEAKKLISKEEPMEESVRSSQSMKDSI